MRIGVTATSDGLTDRQLELFREVLVVMRATEVHHGDCVGGDAQIHEIALELGIDIVIHPPDDDKKRAWCTGAKRVLPRKPYLARDRDIVEDTELLLVGPKGPEVVRSGTWYTKRFAEKTGKPWVLIARDSDRL